MMLPDSLRSLTIVALPDGTFQASLNTRDMPSNSFRVRIAETPTAALYELLRRPAPAVLPPVPV